MTTVNTIPTVLVFGGSDPTGGAGIQADIEAIASMGCHAAAVVTSVTVQDTTNVLGFAPQSAQSITRQARAVLEDMPVAAIKTGMLGSAEAVEAIHLLLRDYPRLPLVVDPVLGAGGGTPLADRDLIDALKALLLPPATVATPNSVEARALAPHADTLEAYALALLELGTDHVLITGAHEDTADVVNVLYANHRRLASHRWERLPGSFHGSGCTLASSLCALLAQGCDVQSASARAQEYTWNALRHGYRAGMGQWLPNRLFWSGRTP